MSLFGLRLFALRGVTGNLFAPKTLAIRNAFCGGLTLFASELVVLLRFLLLGEAVRFAAVFVALPFP